MSVLDLNADKPNTQVQSSVGPWVKQGSPSTKGLIGIFHTLKRKCILPIKNVIGDKPPALEGAIPPPDESGVDIFPLDVNEGASDSVNVKRGLSIKSTMSYNSSTAKNTNVSTNAQQQHSINSAELNSQDSTISYPCSDQVTLDQCNKAVKDSLLPGATRYHTNVPTGQPLIFPSEFVSTAAEAATTAASAAAST